MTTARRGRVLGGAMTLLLLLAPRTHAEETVFTGHGTPFPGGFAGTVPPRSEDPVVQPVEPPSLEDVNAALRKRALSGRDRTPECRLGPVARRIPYDRLRALFDQYQGRPGEELWTALGDEPDEPTADTISIAIPADTGSDCPDVDADEALLKERRAALRAKPAAQAVWRDDRRSPLEQIEAALQARERAAIHSSDCRYGPRMLRVPAERLLFLLEIFEGLPGNDLAQALAVEAQHQDLSLYPIALQFPMESRCDPSPRRPDSDLSVLSHQRRDSELEVTEGVMRSRAASGKDVGPDCFYGPLRRSISPELWSLLTESPNLDGESAWRLINSEPEDPDGYYLTFVVRSGRKPNCPAGDIVERLQRQRERLLREQALAQE